MLTSALGFFLMRGSIVVILALFLLGLNFVVNFREKRRETENKQYPHLGDHANPALS